MGELQGEGGLQESRVACLDALPNNLDEDVEFILNNAEVRVLFLENKEQLQKWQRISKNCKTIEKVIVINNDVITGTNAANTIKWQDLLALGRSQLKENPHTFRADEFDSHFKLVEQGFWCVVKNEVRFVDKHHQFRFCRIAKFGHFFKNLG